MAINPINLVIRARDEASGVLGTLQGKLVAVAGTIAAYFGISAFIGAVKGAGDFEAALSRVQAATGGSKEELAQLRKAAEESGVNSTEAAGALENLAKAGLSAKEAIGALPAVINLAKAGDIELAQASEVVTAAVMGMGLEFGETARVVDVLVMGANETKTSVKGLAEALSYAAPVANSMGLSLESTVAIIGQFAQAGIDASRAGTALNSILSQFNDPASKFRQELAAAGITTGDFEKALHQLAAAGPRGAKAIQAVGLEAGPALLAMLNRGMPALDALTAKLKEAEGAAAAAAKIMKTNLNGSLSDLESAWKYVKDTLTTPVLPVITEAVNDLTTALRGAVQDGTIGRFGDAIAAGFRAAIAWVKDFKAQIDFNKVGADLRAFADRTGEVFTQVGAYATTAGDSAKLAYGVMSAGVNTVLGAVYLIGESFAGVASNIMWGVSRLREELAKVSFGSLSESFQLAAIDARNAAEGFWEASQAMSDKSNAAFVRAAEGAQLARDSFTSLATSATSATPAVSTAAVVVDDLGAKLEATRQKSRDAEKATIDKKAADEAAAVALRQLREEYKALVANGDMQGAADKINEINKALQGTPPAAKDAAKEAEKAAKELAAAFDGLGIKSQASLKMAADSARTYYERIKADAGSTAVDVSNAFKKTAEDIIAANGGVATAWVKSEAAALGFELQVDSAGKTTVKSMGEGSGAVEKMGESFRRMSAEQIKANEEYLDKMMMRYTLSADYTERQIALIEREAEATQKLIDLENKRLNRDREGFSIDPATGQRITQKIDNQRSIYENAKSQGLSDADALKIANQFMTDSGEKIGWNPGGRGGAMKGETWSGELQKAINAAVLANARAQAAQSSAPGAAQPGAPAPAPTYVTNITLPGGGTKAVRMQDADSQSIVNDLVRQLAQARTTSM